MSKKKRYMKIATVLMCTSLLFACNKESTSANDSQNEQVSTSMSTDEINALISEKASYSEDDYYSDWENEDPIYIELNGTDISYDEDAAILYSNHTLTIKTGGTYVISGTLDDGQIAIDAEDETTVRLVLNGVEINSSNNAAINVINAAKTTISLVEGTKNVISDGEEYVYEDSSADEPNAAIFSKDDLTINGTGTLIVNGNYDNGIASKDDLKITSGNIQIHAVDDGLVGRDLVAVKEGDFSIDAGGDGIKTTNDEKTSKGTIAIEGGTFDIAAGNDGIQSIASILISDGIYTITSGGGSPETISNHEERMQGFGGMNEETTETEESETESAKGLKASVNIAIAGGKYNLDTSDDAVHSNSEITIVDGEFIISTGDDGIHGDEAITVNGGHIEIVKSYEGIESKVITMNDGDTLITSNDDGINVGGGNDGSGMDMPGMGMNMQENSEESSDTEEYMLYINGGNITVNAEGDGLDSNGSVEMTGGTVVVNGPTSNGNGPLDYGSTFNISGGFLIAVGSSGMAQATSEQSTQNSILMSYPDTQAAGTLVHLQDDEGNTIVTFKPSKTYQSVLISSPNIKKDDSFTLYSGGATTGSEENGVYEDGQYEAGEKVVDFTVTEAVTWLNESGVTTGNSGSGRGMNNPGGEQGVNNPDGEQMPPDGANRNDPFSDLDEETREKVQDIMQKQREGTLTQDEAQKQLEELGVELPGRGTPPMEME